MLAFFEPLCRFPDESSYAERARWFRRIEDEEATAAVGSHVGVRLGGRPNGRVDRALAVVSVWTLFVRRRLAAASK
jgi:hypothetical protein